MMISLAIFGAGCAAQKSRLIIPSSPRPNEAQTVAIERCASRSPDFAALERRRIIHSCRLEILKQSVLADRCEELINQTQTP